MTYTPEQLSDREKIREAAMRYSYGVDRLDPDVMKSAYWPEATDDHGNFVGNAHEFVDYCMEAHLRWKCCSVLSLMFSPSLHNSKI